MKIILCIAFFFSAILAEESIFSYIKKGAHNLEKKACQRADINKATKLAPFILDINLSPLDRKALVELLDNFAALKPEEKLMVIARGPESFVKCHKRFRSSLMVKRGFHFAPPPGNVKKLTIL